jgi:cytochrome b561
MDRSPARIDAMTLHKSLGITLLLLLLFRFVWRVAHPVPPLPQGSSAWEIRGSRAAHFALYALLAGITLSGWAAASAYLVPWKLWWAIPLPRITSPDKATYEFAAQFHEALVAAFLALLAVHVAAALWHHFIKRDGVLAGMWRGRS